MPKQLTNMDRQVLAAYLPADLAQRARTHAKATGRSLSSLVAEAVAAYFARLDLIERITDAGLLQQLEADALAQIRAERGA
jgi:hypothetical protein